ncbi:MAG: hypothetical protein C6P37_01240 [Caldibacillus debilis]|uniref:Uncharacterized protein n=1 Tax=Caldibacillus debilis TaxID=301148 RepID=A0A3E0K8Q9_9BACI|nr:MAG: hypothetical protein C6P37_01240 [Caldibacillus debilis]
MMKSENLCKTKRGQSGSGPGKLVFPRLGTGIYATTRTWSAERKARWRKENQFSRPAPEPIRVGERVFRQDQGRSFFFAKSAGFPV